MTVIAWDGKSLSADKRMVSGGVAKTTAKLFLVGDKAVAFCGDAASGLAMLEWFKNGAAPEKFPECQKAEGWSRLVVADRDGLTLYEKTPYAIRCEDKIFATGSGADFAYAAMHCGKSSKEAVEVANHFSTECGNGVDTLLLCKQC